MAYLISLLAIAGLIISNVKNVDSFGEIYRPVGLMIFAVAIAWRAALLKTHPKTYWYVFSGLIQYYLASYVIAFVTAGVPGMGYESRQAITAAVIYLAGTLATLALLKFKSWR